MSIIAIRQKFLEIIQKQNNLKGRILADFSEVTELFVEIFGEYPDCYYINGLIDFEKTIKQITSKFETFIPGSYEYYKATENSVEYDKIMYDNDLILDNAIVTIEKDGMTIYTNNTETKDELLKCCVSEKVENPCEVYWVTNGQKGFSATKLKIQDANFDPVNHYNDDFELDKVESFIKSDSSGLCILHGIAGSGKTFLIRHLAQKYPDKKFYFMHQSTLEYIGSDAFISFLFSNSVKNSVFVLEDCETLLADRIREGNHMLGTVLNLSDGILGDGLQIKFICTFNADLAKIDTALLRKGRLKYKYEFKALTPEKTQALAKHLNKVIPEGKSLSVSEIYNWNEDNNGGQINKPNKIGF